MLHALRVVGFIWTLQRAPYFCTERILEAYSSTTKSSVHTSTIDALIQIYSCRLIVLALCALLLTSMKTSPPILLMLKVCLEEAHALAYGQTGLLKSLNSLGSYRFFPPGNLQAKLLEWPSADRVSIVTPRACQTGSSPEGYVERQHHHGNTDRLESS